MIEVSLLQKLTFLRLLTYGQTVKEAWSSAFDLPYSKEAVIELCGNEDFLALKARYEDEIKASGSTRDEVMLELDALNEEARKVTAELEGREKLEAIRVRQKGVELKARVSRKLGDKQEINIAVALPIMGDDGMLKAMEERKALSDGAAQKAEVVDAEFSEVEGG